MGVTPIFQSLLKFISIFCIRTFSVEESSHIFYHHPRLNPPRLSHVIQCSDCLKDMISWLSNRHPEATPMSIISANTSDHFLHPPSKISTRIILPGPYQYLTTGSSQPCEFMTTFSNPPSLHSPTIILSPNLPKTHFGLLYESLHRPLEPVCYFLFTRLLWPISTSPSS